MDGNKHYIEEYVDFNDEKDPDMAMCKHCATCKLRTSKFTRLPPIQSRLRIDKLFCSEKCRTLAEDDPKFNYFGNCFDHQKRITTIKTNALVSFLQILLSKSETLPYLPTHIIRDIAEASEKNKNFIYQSDNNTCFKVHCQSKHHNKMT